MPCGLSIWRVPERKKLCAGLFTSPLVSWFSHRRQLGTAYVSATTGAVATALGLKSLTKVSAALFHGWPVFLYLPSSLSPLRTNPQPSYISSQSSHHPMALRATK